MSLDIHEYDPSELEFGVISDLVRTGTDPEMADWSNPQGAMYAQNWGTVATAPDGKRWVHFFRTLNCDAFHKIHKKIVTETAQGRRPDPEYWIETDPEYGSVHYQKSGVEEIRAREERDADEGRYFQGL